MRLRELPTESATADALLRTEELEHRRMHRPEWQPAALVACALAAAVVLLVPAAGDDCYLWRSSIDSNAGRRLALAVPLLIVALVVVDRLLTDDSERRGSLRLLGSAGIAIGGLIAWAGLANQGGRESCGSSASALMFVGIVLVATVVAGHWARATPPARADIVGPARSGKDVDELSQPEIHSAFALLERRLASGAPTPVRVRPLVPVAVAVTAAVALASGLMPWLELLDPAAIDPVGPAPGVIRTGLWQAPPAETWRWVGLLTLVATLAVAILRIVPARPRALRRYGRSLLAAVATGTGTTVLAGSVAFVRAVPDRLPGGVGYRPGYGVWLAMVAGAALLVLGILPLVLGGGRTLPPARRRVGVAAVALALAAGAGAGLTTVGTAGAHRGEPAAAGTPYPVLELTDSAITDRMGTRLWLSGEFRESFTTSLSGSSDLWLLARSDRRELTVYQWRDGIALPRTTIQHGRQQLLPIGVVGDDLLALVSGRSDEQWVVVSVPLDLRQADLSLMHRNPDGAPYVTPGTSIRARGTGRAGTARNPDGSVVLYADGRTWRIPPDRLTGTETWDLTTMQLATAPGASGRKVLTAPDGTSVWAPGLDGLQLASPGGRPRTVIGPDLDGCPISSSPLSSSLHTTGFGLDAGGNVWLPGNETQRAAVRTGDGVLRPVPGIHHRVNGFHPQPDGSMLVATDDGDSPRLLRIDDAAGAAASYPAAPAPTGRCDRTRAPAAATTVQTELLPTLPVLTPPLQALGQGQPRNLSEAGPLMLGPDGKVARLRFPGNNAECAADGRGGLWWGSRIDYDRSAGTSGYLAVHVLPGARTAVVLPHPSKVPERNRERGSGANGDRFVATLGGGRYGFYGPGRAVTERVVIDDLASSSLAVTDQAVAVSTENLLVSIAADGRRTTLLGRLGGDSVRDRRWPLSTALAAGRPAAEWSNDGTWFRGPDGKVWGYDGLHLYRIDGPGRARVLAGPEQGLPALADEVTVIGPALYFETGTDVVRVRLGAIR